MTMRIRSSQKGFTLLELLVAISILSVILGVIYSSFFSASKTTRLLESDEDVYQTARSLLGLLSRELRSLYYYPSGATKAGLTGVDSEIDGHPGDSIYFLTTSYLRKGSDSREGEMAEIGYFLDVDTGTDAKHLIRSVDPTVDLDFDEGGIFLPLSDRVEELDITYYKEQSDEWLNEWDTKTQQQLPDLIRIELSVLDDEERPAHFHTVIQPNLQR